MILRENIVKNLALIAGSLLFAFLLTIVADRIAGRFSPNPVLPGTMELIFPPNSEQTFETCDFTYSVHINSLGLRDRDIPPERTDKYRVLAIGDSFTYGWGVDIDEAWVKQLEKNLGASGLNVEVINASKPGAGPPFYADTAARLIPIFRPDLVSVDMMQGGDLVQSGREGLRPIPTPDVLDIVRRTYPNFVRLIRMAQQARQIAADVQPVTPPWKNTAEENRHWMENTAREALNRMTPEQRARFDALEDKVKDAFLSGRLNPALVTLSMQHEDFLSMPLDLEAPWVKRRIRNLSEQLQRIKRVTDDYHVRLMVIMLPYGAYVNRRACDNLHRIGFSTNDAMLTTDAPDTAVRMACDRAGVPFFSVAPGFREHMNDENLFFELDGHFTPAGNKLFADLMTPIFANQVMHTATPANIGITGRELLVTTPGKKQESGALKETEETPSQGGLVQ